MMISLRVYTGGEAIASLKNELLDMKDSKIEVCVCLCVCVCVCVCLCVCEESFVGYEALEH